MRRLLFPSWRKTCATALFLAAAAGSPLCDGAWGATKTWDLDSSGHNDGLVNNGSGTWDTSTSNWTTDGGTNNTTWTNGDDAVFGGNAGVGTAGTVSVSGTVSANSITFNPATSGAFLLTGGTINLTGAGMIVRNNDATIASVLGGSVGLTKTGTATLTLTGANTVSGTATISNGIVVLAGPSGSLTNINTTTGYVINSGVLRLDNSVGAGGNHSSNDRLANAAPITLNTGTFNFINNGTSSSETVGTLLAASGASTVQMGGGGSSVLTFGSYSRSAGATLNFTNLGAFNHTIAITGQASGFLDQGTFVDGADYAVYSAGTITAMTVGAGSSFYDTAMTSGRHVKLSSTPGSSQGSISILTLNLAGATAGLTLGNNATLTLTNGGIIKAGHGSGTIQGGNSNTAISSATEYVINTVFSDDTLTINEKMVGGTSFTKTGLGTVTLGTASNSWTGSTYIDQGKLKNGTANVLPDADPVILGDGATWDMNANSDTVGSLTLHDGATLMTASGTPKVSLNGNTGGVTYTGGLNKATISANLELATSGTGTHVFDVARGSSSTGVDLDITGNITDGGSANIITKSSAGNLRFAGTGSWGGDTNINAGTFTVDGSIGAASGKNVNVNSGGKLAGSGTISRNINLNSGGTISPKGDSGGSASTIGTLNTSTQTWNGGSTYVWEINSATGSAGSGYDTMALSGTLSIAATSGNKMTIKVVSNGPVSGWNRNSVWHWTIASSSNAIAALAGNFQLDTSQFLDDNNGDAGSFSVDLDPSGKAIRVNYVPEPTSALLLGGMGAMGLMRRRRRSRSNSK